MQIFYVNIGGGEPTVRPDFWELLDYAVDHHVGVKFSTNGFRITRERAAELAATDYVDVQISLDGATADVNDHVRGAGTYDAAMRAMANLQAAGMSGFKLSVVCTRHNIGQLDEFKAIADRYGAQLRLTRLRPSGRGADVWDELHPTALSHHVVLVGYGRVGGLIGRALKERHETFLVVEDADRLVANLREQKIEVIPGNAVEPRVLEAANVKGARLLLIAIPNGFEAGQIVQQSRALNPQLHIVARAHSNDEVEYLLRLSADAVIMGEREIARGMIEQAFGAEDLASGMAAPALADRVSSV